MTEVLYTKKPNTPSWAWELLTDNKELFDKATEWAKANGYTEFRTQNIDNTAPDFTRTVTNK